MSDHSRKAALDTDNGVECNATAASSHARGLDDAHAELMPFTRPHVAGTPPAPGGPPHFLPGRLPAGLNIMSDNCRARASTSRPARDARIACVAWAASSTPVPAIDGGVVPPNDLEPTAALYFGMQEYAPAGKKTTCTQEGGHVKASSKKIRAPSSRAAERRDPRGA